MGDNSRKLSSKPIMLNRVYTCDPVELHDIYVNHPEDTIEPENDKSTFIRTDGLPLLDGNIFSIKFIQGQKTPSKKDKVMKSETSDVNVIPVFIGDNLIIPSSVTVRDLDYGKRPKLFYRSVLVTKPVQIPRYESEGGVKIVSDKSIAAELTLPQLETYDEIFLKKLKGLCKKQPRSQHAELVLSSDSEDDFADSTTIVLKSTVQNKASAQQVELFKLQMDQIQRRLLFQHTGKIEDPPVPKQRFVTPNIENIPYSRVIDEFGFPERGQPRLQFEQMESENSIEVQNRDANTKPLVKSMFIKEEKSQVLNCNPKLEGKATERAGGKSEILLIRTADLDENCSPIPVAKQPSNKAVSFQPASKSASKLTAFQPVSKTISKSASSTVARGRQKAQNRTVGGAGDDIPAVEAPDRSPTPERDLLQGNLNTLKAPRFPRHVDATETLHITADHQSSVMNGGKLYRCTACDCAFHTVDRVNSHMRMMSSVGKQHTVGFTCDKSRSCVAKSLKFPIFEQLVRHLMNEHKEKWLPCLHCSNQYNMQMLWMNHMKNEHDRKLLNICVPCQKYYSNHEALIRHRLKRHIQTTNPEKPASAAKVFFLPV